jgi:hypothetical protein
LLGGQKEVVEKSFSFMLGTEIIITHGDPEKIEVIAFQEVSFSIVVLIYNQYEGKNVMISASYIIGLTDGEGCFLVSLRKDNRIDLRFFITQAIGNKSLLNKVQEYFKVGTVYQKSAGWKGRLPAYVFEVSKRDDIYKVVIPFFTKHKLLGDKARSFRAFCKIAKVVKDRQDIRKLDSKELSYVRRLKFGMNKHYGSPGAVNPLVGWERAIASSKAQSVK